VTVVLDSSALITLARIGRLELLHQIASFTFLAPYSKKSCRGVRAGPSMQKE